MWENPFGDIAKSGAIGPILSLSAKDSPGRVFELTPSGTLTTLSFCSQARCTDGTQPNPGVTQGIDGNFYGTTF